jgi:hypothetical protein
VEERAEAGHGGELGRSPQGCTSPAGRARGLLHPGRARNRRVR